MKRALKPPFWIMDWPERWYVQTHSTKRSFTLIELLVVVAIIAVLVALLLPTLAAARRQARRVICSGRLHSWGQILTMYADDNSGFYITRYDSNATDSWDRWPTHWWAAPGTGTPAPTTCG